MISTLFLVASCGNRPVQTDSRPEVSKNPLENKPLEITQRETVTFHRLRKMISRYDCTGNVISRKLETMNNLSKKITIDYEERDNIWSYSVFNRRTRSSGKGLFTHKGQFIVDYSPTAFNMRVKSGLNAVAYSISTCSEVGQDENANPVCTGTEEVAKEGIVQLDVYYSSETLPGEDHIHPTPESCKPETL